MIWTLRAEARIFAYLNGVPTDITDYALTVGDRAQRITTSNGRQTMLAQYEPSTFSMVLKNNDGRFTPGNTSSPYAPYWKMGTRIVFTETIGHRTYTFFDGHIEIPEDSLTYQAADDETITDQVIQVNAVDTLTWLSRQRPFPSTVAAHVAGSARNSALVGYYPLLDTALPFRPFFGPTPYSTSIPTRSSDTNFTQAAAITPAGAPPLPGDDMSTALFIPELLAIGGVYRSPGFSVIFDTGVATLAAGQALTLVMWLRRSPAEDTTSSSSNLAFWAISGGAAAIGVNLNRVFSSSGNYFQATFSPGSALTGSVDAALGSAAGSDRWYLIGVRFTYTPNSLELWVDDATYTATTPTGTPTGTYNAPQLAVTPFGPLAHLQLYIGAAADFTHADFLAQREVGLNGLHRQLTGSRIRTVLGYAGLSTSQLDRIDPGTSVMSIAELSGKTALDACNEAVETEQGRLFTAGDGLPAFHDRHRIYNT